MRAAWTLSFVVTAAACPTPDDPCRVTEPSYGGLGNDEVWLTLEDARDRAATGADSATISAPTDGAVLDKAGEPLQVTWLSPLKLAAAGATSSSDSLRPVSPAPAFDRAFSWVIPRAHAHLPPVTSDAYLLEIEVPGRACPLQVVTTELSHTLDAASWAELTASGGAALTLSITSAYLSSGRITEGPFAAAPVGFRVE